MPTPGERLRSAFAKEPLAIPGVFCPIVAMMAERMGFSAAYLSGAALSATLGLPDIGLVTCTEFVEAARSITRACGLPLLCDADTGFGEALNVERSVRLFEQAGTAGIHLEDQEMPKRCGHLSGKSLISAEEMVRKVRAAIKARRDPGFVIIARTDAFGVMGFDEAVRRAKMYREAGADVIFPEALSTPNDFTRMAEALPNTPLLANMTEFGKSPLFDRKELGRMGYRLVLYPVSGLRVALKAVGHLFEGILTEGHQRNHLGQMMTRAELYQLLQYDGYDERDRSYFG